MDIDCLNIWIINLTDIFIYGINGGKWRIVGYGASIYRAFVIPKPQYIDISKFVDYTPYQIVCQVSTIWDKIVSYIEI